MPVPTDMSCHTDFNKERLLPAMLAQLWVKHKLAADSRKSWQAAGVMCAEAALYKVRCLCGRYRVPRAFCSTWTHLFQVTDVRPKMLNTTGYKRTCACSTCIMYLTSAWWKTCSADGSLELGSLHTQGAVFWENTSHQPRVLIGYWVNQFSSVKWRGVETLQLVQRTMN